MQESVPVAQEEEWSTPVAVCTIIGFFAFVIGAVALMEMVTVRGPAVTEPSYASTSHQESK